MRLSRFTEKQIIGMLKEQEAGAKSADVCRKHGISAATFNNFKAKFGGMEVSGATSAKGSGGRRPPARKHRPMPPSYVRRVRAGQHYRVLANPIYVGRLRHKDQVHDGQHQGTGAPARFKVWIASRSAFRSRAGPPENPPRPELSASVFH
jgi:hypothetical protein